MWWCETEDEDHMRTYHGQNVSRCLLLRPHKQRPGAGPYLLRVKGREGRRKNQCGGQQGRRGTNHGQ